MTSAKEYKKLCPTCKHSIKSGRGYICDRLFKWPVSYVFSLCQSHGDDYEKIEKVTE